MNNSLEMRVQSSLEMRMYSSLEMMVQLVHDVIEYPGQDSGCGANALKALTTKAICYDNVKHKTHKYC